MVLKTKNNQQDGLPAAAKHLLVQESDEFWIEPCPSVVSEASYWQRTPAAPDDWSRQAYGGDGVSVSEMEQEI